MWGGGDFGDCETGNCFLIGCKINYHGKKMSVKLNQNVRLLSLKQDHRSTGRQAARWMYCVIHFYKKPVCAMHEKSQVNKKIPQLGEKRKKFE